ncbi:hypothetical protein [Nitrosomonas oligotropha]|nr:hypothetical protein [Nitrosomonas oligotropha]
MKEHAEMMRLHPYMKHTGSNRIDVLPGEHKELIWHFTNSGTINFACNYSGRFKMMRGKINVEAE